MSHSPHRDGLLSCVMNTPVSKEDSNNIKLFAKVIPFQIVRRFLLLHICSLNVSADSADDNATFN